MVQFHHMAERKLYSSNELCIYCGVDFDEEHLTKEHIVPFALSGSWQVLGACHCCAKKSNQEYEQSVLQSDTIRTMRAFLSLKRRKKKKAIPMPPIFRSGTASITKLEEVDFLTTGSVSEYPKLMILFKLLPPRKLICPSASSDENLVKLWFRNISGKKLGQAVNTDPVKFKNFYTSPTDSIVSMELKHHDGQAFSIRQKFNAVLFMRMLAKIAYCFAVAENGFDKYKETNIRKLVNGERSDFHNFVGGTLNEEKLTNRYLHHLAFRDRDGVETVIVNLFSSYEAPAYEVVLL